jgi:predicted ester cyclase
MTTTETEHTTFEAYLDALTTGGPFADFLTDDVTFALVGTEVSLVGREPVEAFIRGFHEQAFDSTLEIGSLCVDGERGTAAVELVFGGRHIAEVMGIPATGREVRVPYSAHYALRGESIAAIRVYGLVAALVEALTA